MSGSSGARVTVRDGYVVKQGNRAAEQGRWLRDHAWCESLVRIIEVASDGYSMERLDEAGSVRVNDVLPAVSLLWVGAPDHLDLDADALTQRLALNFALVNESDKLAAALVKRLHRPVNKCLTHGDLTAENVMRNSDGFITLIDPLPSSPVAPDWQEVDIAKMMQSATAWHLAVYDEKPAQRWTLDDFADAFDDELFDAAVKWLPVHLARTIRYVPPSKREEVMDLVYSTAGL